MILRHHPAARDANPLLKLSVHSLQRRGGTDTIIPNRQGPRPDGPEPHRSGRGLPLPDPRQETDGPSWLSFIGHMKDSLWSVDLFRCESLLLRSHWIMVVMDVFTRRIIGFAVDRANLCGVSVCRMFNRIIAGKALPRHLSCDHDPLFRFDRWRANLRILEVANLRILEVEEIKSIPYVPVSHPFVERLIGTIRREFLDHVLIWNAVDLEQKLGTS